MTRSSKLKLLAAVAIAAAVLRSFLWFASEVYEGETLAFDTAIREWIHGFASPQLTTFFTGVTFLGSTSMIVVLGVIAVITFLVLRDRAAALVVAIVMMGESALSYSLKEHYARARPEAYFGYAEPTSYSFPSGHSFASFCLYLTLAWLISRRVPNGIAVAVWTAAVVIVGLVGLSRVYLGVHYPTDVIGGYLAAAMWSSVVLFAYHKYLRRSSAVLTGR